MLKGTDTKSKRSSLAIASSVPYFTKRGVVASYEKEPRTRKIPHIPPIIDQSNRLKSHRRTRDLDSTTMSVIRSIKQQLKCDISSLKERHQRELQALRRQVITARDNHAVTLNRVRQQEKRSKDIIHQQYNHVCGAKCSKGECNLSRLMCSLASSPLHTLRQPQLLVQRFYRTLKFLKNELDGEKSNRAVLQPIKKPTFQQGCLQTQQIEQTLKQEFGKDVLEDSSNDERNFYESVVRSYIEKYSMELHFPHSIQELNQGNTGKIEGYSNRVDSERRVARNSRNAVPQPSGYTTRAPSIFQPRVLKRASGERYGNAYKSPVQERSREQKLRLSNKTGRVQLQQSRSYNRDSLSRFSKNIGRSEPATRNPSFRDGRFQFESKLIAKRRKRKLNRLFGDEQGRKLLEKQLEEVRANSVTKEGWLNRQLASFLEQQQKVSSNSSEEDSVSDQEDPGDSKCGADCKQQLLALDADADTKQSSRNSRRLFHFKSYMDASSSKFCELITSSDLVNPNQSIPLLRRKLKKLFTPENLPKELKQISKFYDMHERKLKEKQQHTQQAFEQCFNAPCGWDWVNELQFQLEVHDINANERPRTVRRFGEPTVLPDFIEEDEPLVSYVCHKPTVDERHLNRKNGFLEESRLFSRKGETNRHNQQLCQFALV